MGGTGRHHAEWNKRDADKHCMLGVKHRMLIISGWKDYMFWGLKIKKNGCVSLIHTSYEMLMG